jgi:hypothetical protein
MNLKCWHLFTAAPLLLGVCLGGGCSPAAAPPGPPSPSGPERRDGPGDFKKPQLLAVTAEELTKELDRDGGLAAVRKKYDNQLLEVTGTVRTIEKADLKGAPPTGGSLDLFGCQTSEGILTVLCLLDPPDSAPIPDIKLGQKVTIRGSFTSAYQGFILMAHCKWIEPGKPSSAP